MNKPTLFLAMAVAMAPMAVQADEEDIIKYRQAEMKAMKAHMKSLGFIVKGKVPFADEAQGHADAMADLLANMTAMFPEGSDFGADTTAAAAIWEDPETFAARAEDAAKAGQTLAQAAASGDMAKLGAAMGAVGKSCKGCHKAFRER